LKFLQIWQLTAVRHGGRRAPRRLGTNCHSARWLEAGHSVLRWPTTVGPNRPRRQG
jgi:hypothetical protein